MRRARLAAATIISGAIDGGARNRADHRMIMRSNPPRAIWTRRPNCRRNPDAPEASHPDGVLRACEAARSFDHAAACCTDDRHVAGDHDPSAADRAELAEAWSWLAAVLDEGFGDAEGAADALARAVEAGPMRPDLWNRFATFTEKHQRRQDFDDILLASADALAERAETPLPQVEAVAMVLRDPAGQLDAASRVLLAALRAQPPQTRPLALMLGYGWAASRSGGYDQLRRTSGRPAKAPSIWGSWRQPSAGGTWRQRSSNAPMVVWKANSAPPARSTGAICFCAAATRKARLNASGKPRPSSRITWRSSGASRGLWPPPAMRRKRAPPSSACSPIRTSRRALPARSSANCKR